MIGEPAVPAATTDPLTAIGVTPESPSTTVPGAMLRTPPTWTELTRYALTPPTGAIVTDVPSATLEYVRLTVLAAAVPFRMLTFGPENGTPEISEMSVISNPSDEE